MYVCVQSRCYTKQSSKIAAGHWQFSMQFFTMATQNLTMIVSNCTDGQSKFQLGQPNPKPDFQLCSDRGLCSLLRFSSDVRIHLCTLQLHLHVNVACYHAQSDARLRITCTCKYETSLSFACYKGSEHGTETTAIKGQSMGLRPLL